MYPHRSRAPRARRPGAALGLTALLLASCYAPRVEPRPLQPCAVLSQVKRERVGLPEGDTLNLAQATARLRRLNPEVRRRRAEWQTAEALAGVPTPLPNPTLGLGAILLAGSDLVQVNGIGAEVGLGWAIPLAQKRALRDCLNAIRAEAALVAVAATEREAYLGLRREHIDAVLREGLREAHRELEATARETVDRMKRNVEAGQAMELDVDLLELAAEEFTTQGLRYETETQDALAAWRSSIAAADGRALRPDPQDVPPLPTAAPEKTDLEALLLRDHPALARLRAEYLVAEKELRLEAARAYPDLQLDPYYENEVEVQKLGLPVGIELPIFDRNQPGIAQATARRDEVRERYAAALTDQLADLEGALRRVEGRERVLAGLERQVAMGAKMIAAAKHAVERTGGVDLARYLEVLRTARRVRVEEIETRADLYDAWMDLEAACGAPLLRFAHQPGATSIAAGTGDDR